jgi:myosin heavy subunit
MEMSQNNRFKINNLIWIPNPFPQGSDEEDDESTYRVGWFSPTWCGRPVWVPGIVLSEVDSKGDVQVMTDLPTRLKLTCSTTKLFHRNPIDDPDKTDEDMTNIVHLHDAEVLNNLIRRFNFDEIYTIAGAILIALNPYKIVENWQGTEYNIYDSK